jgi:Flp pilus assembly protein TadG
MALQRWRRRDDRGDATTEVVLAVPVMLLLVMVVIQAGLWFHGSQLVEAAAQEGVQAGRADGGSAAVAERRAREFIVRLSPSIAGSAEVHATRTPETTRVVVTGRVQQVVPGLRLGVTGAAEAPTERFREDR